MPNFTWAGEPGVFGSSEIDKKKPGAGAAWKKKSGAGAAKKLAGSSALLEDKMHKETVLLLHFFRHNSKFLWLNKQLFYFFIYFFCSFTLLVSEEKNILPNLTNSRSRFFLAWSRSRSNKYKEPPALEKKISSSGL